MSGAARLNRGIFLLEVGALLQRKTMGCRLRGRHGVGNAVSLAVLLIGFFFAGDSLATEGSLVNSSLIPAKYQERFFQNTAADNSSLKGAQSFTMRGASATLTSISLYLRNSNFAVGTDSYCKVTLHADNSGVPGTQLAILHNQLTIDDNTGMKAYVINYGAYSIQLQANTKYWIVLESTGGWNGTDGGFEWDVVADLDRSTSSVVADMTDYALLDSQGANWEKYTADAFRIDVKGDYYAVSTISVAAYDDATIEPDTYGEYKQVYLLRQGYDLSEVSVDWRIVGSGSSPAEPNDIQNSPAPSQFPSGTVTFASRETQQIIYVYVIGDQMVEPEIETYDVEIRNPSAGAIIGTSNVTCKIENNDSATLSLISNGSVNEGNSGTTFATFSVQIAQPDHPWVTTIEGGLMLDVYTYDDTATLADGDYSELFGASVIIPAGQTSVTFQVEIFGDTIIEPDEQFMVMAGYYGDTYWNLVSFAQDQDMAYFTILNDDASPPPPGKIMIQSDSVNGGGFEMSWHEGTNTYRLESATRLFPTANWQQVTGLTNTQLRLTKEEMITTNRFYRLIQTP